MLQQAKHKRIHAGVKKYTCEFCPLRFTALGKLGVSITTRILMKKIILQVL